MALGVTSCKVCAKLVNSDEKFCRECGASTNEVVNCPKCKTSRKKANYRFETNTFTRVNTFQQSFNLENPAIGTIIQPIPENLAHFCTECGYNFD